MRELFDQVGGRAGQARFGFVGRRSEGTQGELDSVELGLAVVGWSRDADGVAWVTEGAEAGRPQVTGNGLHCASLTTSALVTIFVDWDVSLPASFRRRSKLSGLGGPRRKMQGHVRTARRALATSEHALATVRCT